MKRLVLETTKRVGYDGRYYLIVPDHAAGSANARFTVYQLPGSPSRRVKVVGRELPLGLARAVASGRHKRPRGRD